MTQADIDRWFAENGGELRREGPDANGVTVYYARNGQFINIDSSGLPRMRGFSPPDAEAPTAPAASAPAPRGGGPMNQAELDAYIAAQAPGGDVNNWEFNRGTKTKELTTVTGTRTVQVPFVQWIDRKTGRTLEYEVQPGGGAYTEVYNGVKPENKGKPGETTGFKEGDVRGPANGKKRERFTNGQWVEEPNPLYEAPASENKPQTVPTNTTEPFIVTRQPDGTLKSEPNPNYKGPEQKPGSTLQIKGADGKVYLVPVDAQGKPGKPQMLDIPGEGPSTPTTAGPQLPQIVLGASQDAARTYKQQLQEGVASGRWSQAWADARWREFMEVANLAVSESATRQREMESTRNASFNLAQQKQNAMGTATSNALTFVNSINGSLPAGSNLGGQAFAALLGINMIQSLASGIQTFNPNVKPPQITPADLSNPTALAAKRDELGQAIREATPTVIAATDANIGRLTAPPRPAAVPAAPAPAAPPRVAPPAASIVPNETPNPGPVPGQDIVPELVPQQAQPEGPAGVEALPEPPAPEAPAPGEEMVTVTSRFGVKRTYPRRQWEQIKNSVYIRLGGWTEDAAAPQSAGYPEAPAMGPGADQTNTGPIRVVPSPTVTGSREAGYPDAPIMGPNAEQTNTGPVRVVPSPTIQNSRDAGYPDTPMMGPNAEQTNTGPIRVLPSQTVIDSRGNPSPVEPDWNAPITKAMPAGMGEWAALAPMIPQQPMPQPQQAQGTPGMPVAAMRAWIASTPPWRLSTEEIEWAEQNGFGQEAWAVPGRVA